MITVRSAASSQQRYCRPRAIDATADRNGWHASEDGQTREKNPRDREEEAKEGTDLIAAGAYYLCSCTVGGEKMEGGKEFTGKKSINSHLIDPRVITFLMLLTSGTVVSMRPPTDASKASPFMMDRRNRSSCKTATNSGGVDSTPTAGVLAPS